MRCPKIACGISLLVLVLSTIGCATPNNTMQSLVQKFKSPMMKSETIAASSGKTKQDPRVNALLDDAIASWYTFGREGLRPVMQAT